MSKKGGKKPHKIHKNYTKGEKMKIVLNADALNGDKVEIKNFASLLDLQEQEVAIKEIVFEIEKPKAKKELDPMKMSKSQFAVYSMNSNRLFLLQMRDLRDKALELSKSADKIWEKQVKYMEVENQVYQLEDILKECQAIIRELKDKAYYICADKCFRKSYLKQAE